MSIIDEHIKETEEIISSNDQDRVKEQYNKLFSIYKAKIDSFEQGTTVLQTKMNIVLNMNDGINLPTNSDYIKDLKLLVEKLKLYKQQIEPNYGVNCKNNIQSQGDVCITDNSINIETSNIQKSAIGNNQNKKSGWKIFAGVIGVLAGIVAILTFVLDICGFL
jgi:hypothetical protein